MKIVDFVREQCRCGKCTEGKIVAWEGGGVGVQCDKSDMTNWTENCKTCGSWYLALTTPANPALIGDRPHTTIYAYDFASWLNLYQCPKPPQIRVLERDAWPEVSDD